MKLNLKGKKALVTGGSHGIGLAIKKALEEEGVKVMSISKSEGYDVMKHEDCKKIGVIASQVDILINCVGGMGTSKFVDFPECIRKNLVTTIGFTCAFLMNKKKSWGRVITISSFYGKEKGPNPWFVASKAGQIGFMKSLAGKHKKFTFNTICPGIINTKESNKQFAEQNKLTLGEPEDVANIVTFLCSDLAKHINGAVITVDGGDSYSF